MATRDEAVKPPTTILYPNAHDSIIATVGVWYFRGVPLSSLVRIVKAPGRRRETSRPDKP
jgi:hypothetical protein